METHEGRRQCGRVCHRTWFVLSAFILILGEPHEIAAQKPSQRNRKAQENQIEELEQSAARGDATAMYHLGRMYEYGSGVSKDVTKARQWLEKASSAGSAAAMNDLGSMCEEGKGKPRDHAEARHWYTQSAGMGYSEAMANLGSLYRQGHGVPKDYRLAQRWYRKAAALRNANAMNSLGWIYEKGEGVPQDYRQAQMWYEKAVALPLTPGSRSGRGAAMDNLGLMYQHGEAVPPEIDKTPPGEHGPDYNRARYWFEQSIALGNASAMNNLGILYGFARGFATDYGQALYWFRKAAAFGSSDAMNDLGTMYYYGRGVPQDYKQARNWWERAVARGNDSAMADLGYLYQCGNGVLRDMKKAIRLYEKAAARGSASGMNNLALMYSGVIGVPVDRVKQREWLEKAAALNDPTAIYGLARMYDDPEGVPQDYVLARSWYEKAAALVLKENDNDFGSLLSMDRLAEMYEHGIGVAKDYSKTRGWYEKAAALGDVNAMQGLARIYGEGLGVAKDERRAGEWQGKAALLRPSQPAVDHEDEKIPLCDPDSIDGTFTFADQPAGQTVSLHFQNKSNAACRLHGQAGPSFAVDGHSMNVASCWLCDEKGTPSPAPERQSGNQILLAPGERAVLDLHWSSTGESCQWADWVDFVFVRWAASNPYYSYLFIPSEWPMHICSAVKSSGYRAEPDSPSISQITAPVLHVFVMQTAIYSDEHATLHVELSGLTPSVASQAGCASLYTVRQGPPIRKTRLDPLRPIGSSSRPSYTPGQIKEDKERAWPSWKANHLRTCAIAGAQTTADADISAADLADVTHVEWRTATSPDPAFVTAATHFSVLDVDTLAPDWGVQVEGIRAGLSVDRPRFTMGERIPLHLRWENVNAAMPLAAGECKEPEPALEVQDSQHNVVQTIPIQPLCMGHGWGPFSIPKGEAQRAFIELATEYPTTTLPNTYYFNGDGTTIQPVPGVYYLVSVWSPRVLDTSHEADKTPRIGTGFRFGKVYATARSLPVRVEVAPRNNP
jgi:TPR repeat protein